MISYLSAGLVGPEVGNQLESPRLVGLELSLVGLGGSDHLLHRSIFFWTGQSLAMMIVVVVWRWWMEVGWMVGGWRQTVGKGDGG